LFAAQCINRAVDPCQVREEGVSGRRQAELHIRSQTRDALETRKGLTEVCLAAIRSQQN